jgi:hypothetical protein
MKYFNWQKKEKTTCKFAPTKKTNATNAPITNTCTYKTSLSSSY